MSVQIRFYTIFGKYDTFENQLRELVSRLRNELKLRGKEPEKLNLTMIKIKEEVLDTILKYVREEAQPPEHLRSLIEYLKSDNVTTFPTLVINGKKVAEGALPDIKVVEDFVIDELRNVVGVNLREPVRVAEQKPTAPAPPVRTEEVSAGPAPPVSAPVSAPTTVATAPPQTTAPAQPSTPAVSPTPAQQPTVQPSPVQTPQPEETRPIAEARVETVTPVYYARSAPSNCAECVYYGFNTKYCFLLGKKVDDITRPPCMRESL